MTAIIFDLDDTLYKEHDYVRSGFKAVAEALVMKHKQLDVEQLYNELVSVWHEFGRGEVFNIVCERFGIDVEIAQLVGVYRNHMPNLSLYSDADKFLNWLKKKEGVKTGIITDGHEITQRKKIEALRLHEVIDVIVVTDELGRDCWKPSPIPYLEAAKRLGVPIEECTYIGDNPHKDFITAKRLGMKTVRIMRPVGDHMQTRLSVEYEADEIITQLTDLLSLLD